MWETLLQRIQFQNVLMHQKKIVAVSHALPMPLETQFYEMACRIYAVLHTVPTRNPHDRKIALWASSGVLLVLVVLEEFLHVRRSPLQKVPNKN